MAKKKASRQKKMNTRVDFTPMVDMMMLLITFFMLCTSLAKPQTMNLTMPSNDKNINDKDRNAAKASQTVTIYVCGNDKIYHVDGIPNYADPNCLKETTWGKNGIRDVLIKHVTEDGSTPVADIMAAKIKLDQKKLANPAAYPDSVYDAELSKITKAVEGFHHLRGIGDDGLFNILVKCCHEMVGNGIVNTKLYLLWINKHQLQFVGMLLIQQ